MAEVVHSPTPEVFVALLQSPAESEVKREQAAVLAVVVTVAAAMAALAVAEDAALLLLRVT